MRCIVTAGPTYEKLDDVRRLTNFSTGQLGTQLAAYLTACGHDVTLLIGEQATYLGERRAKEIQVFSTTADLKERLQKLAPPSTEAVFHAAAVSDFTFGQVWIKSPSGELTQADSKKISTREGTLFAELVPTQKIISGLRALYPKARLIGWKFEVEGDRDGVIAMARKQIADGKTDACVANGKAYGEGFGLVTSASQEHLKDSTALFAGLEKFALRN